MKYDIYNIAEKPRKWASDASGEAAATKRWRFLPKKVLISNKNQRFSVKKV